MTNRSMPNDHKVGNKWRTGMRPTNAFTAEQAREINPVAGSMHNCAHCGLSFEVKPWIERQNRTKSGRRFCSKTCHATYKAQNEAGPNSADWVGGITTYRGKGWLEARAEAVTRDGGACQDCGKVVGTSIPVHHKRPFRLFATASEANALDNLICLCSRCHMRAERALAA